MVEMRLIGTPQECDLMLKELCSDFISTYCIESLIFHSYGRSYSSIYSRRRYKIDIDDSFVCMKGTNDAVGNIRVYYRERGWEAYFPVEIKLVKGCSVVDLNTGIAISDKLALTAANYMNDNY